jgi:hypothetical protein
LWQTCLAEAAIAIPDTADTVILTRDYSISGVKPEGRDTYDQSQYNCLRNTFRHLCMLLCNCKYYLPLQVIFYVCTFIRIALGCDWRAKAEHTDEEKEGSNEKHLERLVWIWRLERTYIDMRVRVLMC